MRKQNAALVFILITLFIDSAGVGLIIPVLKELIETYNSDPTQVDLWFGVLQAAYALMAFLFSPFLGALSDRFGRRPVLLVSLAGQGVDYLFMSFANSLPLFLVGRIIAGVAGASYTTAQAYIADITPPEKRAHSYGLVGMAFGIGFIVGPFIGGMVGSWFDYRAPFYVAAGLSLLNTLYGAFVLPESLPADRRSPLNFKKANPLGALLALTRFPSLAAMVAIYGLLALAGQVMPSVWVLYTSFSYSWGPDEIGISLLYVGVLVGLVQGLLTRPVVKKLGERRAIQVGLLLAFVGMALLGPANQTWMLFALMVPYCFSGVGSASLQALMSMQVSPREQGQLQGSLMSLMGVMAFLAPLIYTNIFAFFTDGRAGHIFPGSPFWLAALFLLVSYFISLVALRKVKDLRPSDSDSSEMAAEGGNLNIPE